MARRFNNNSKSLLAAVAMLLLLVPASYGQPRNNNDWLFRQQQRQNDQIRQQQIEQQRRQQQEQQRQRQQQQLQEQQRQRQADLQRQRMQEIQQQRLQEAQRQRMQDLQRQQMQSAAQRAAQAQQAARLSARQQAALGNQPKDRLTFSNGVAKLNKPPTTAEMRKGFTGKVIEGRAVVKVRGKVLIVPASRIGVKWSRPANDNIAAAGGAGGPRPPGNAVASAAGGGQRPPGGGGGGWDWNKQSAMTARVQQLASLNASALAKARTRIAANDGGKQPPGASGEQIAANDNVLRISGKIVGQYSAVVLDGSAGPLDKKTAETFRSGRYTAIDSDRAIVLYRAWHPEGVAGAKGASEFGKYWSLDKPQGSVQARMNSAVRPPNSTSDDEWGNLATRYTAIRVPAGTRLYEGIAGYQTSAWAGGGSQVVIEGGPKESWKIDEGELK